MTAGRDYVVPEAVEALVLIAESESKSQGIYNDHSGGLEALMQSNLGISEQLPKCLPDESDNGQTPRSVYTFPG